MYFLLCLELDHPTPPPLGSWWTRKHTEFEWLENLKCEQVPGYWHWQISRTWENVWRSSLGSNFRRIPTSNTIPAHCYGRSLKNPFGTTGNKLRRQILAQIAGESKLDTLECIPHDQSFTHKKSNWVTIFLKLVVRACALSTYTGVQEACRVKS